MPTVVRDDKYRDVIPKISEEAYQALKLSITEHGMLYAIVLDSEGAIVDGHNRHRAYLELATEGINVELKTRALDFTDEAAAKSYIRASNIARRQLTGKQRRKVINDELLADPESSSRAIAARLGVDHKTVESVRQELEARGEFPHVDTRTDTKGRKQPSSRTRRQEAPQEPQEPEPVNSGHEPIIEPTALDDGNGMDPEAAKDEATRGENSPTETRIGQDGKNYQATKPIDVQPDAVAAAPVPPPDPKREAIREAVRTLLLAVYDEDHWIEKLAEEKHYEGKDFDMDQFEEGVDEKLLELVYDKVSEVVHSFHWHSKFWEWLGLKEIKAKRQPRSH
jgi:hypothetical protein